MIAPPSDPPRRALSERLLGAAERTGNALPHPATMFALLAVAVVLLSWCFAAAGIVVTNPATG